MMHPITTSGMTIKGTVSCSGRGIVEIDVQRERRYVHPNQEVHHGIPGSQFTLAMRLW